MVPTATLKSAEPDEIDPRIPMIATRIAPKSPTHLRYIALTGLEATWYSVLALYYSCLLILVRATTYRERALPLVAPHKGPSRARSLVNVKKGTTLNRVSAFIILTASSSFGATVAQMSGTVFPPPQGSTAHFIPVPVVAVIMVGVGGLILGLFRKGQRADNQVQS
jgi:hypothetical protein